jgi:hypothetical protein
MSRADEMSADCLRLTYEVAFRSAALGVALGIAQPSDEEGSARSRERRLVVLGADGDAEAMGVLLMDQLLRVSDEEGGYMVPATGGQEVAEEALRAVHAVVLRRLRPLRMTFSRKQTAGIVPLPAPAPRAGGAAGAAGGSGRGGQGPPQQKQQWGGFGKLASLKLTAAKAMADTAARVQRAAQTSSTAHGGGEPQQAQALRPDDILRRDGDL